MIDARLRFVETVDEASELMRWLGERRQVLGIDTETEGLKLYSGHAMRLWQVGDTQMGWAVDLFKWRGLIEQVMTYVRRDALPTVFHNAKFDFHAMEVAGLPVPMWSRTHDTAIMAKLLEPHRRAGMKTVGERYWPGSGAGEQLLNEAKRKGGWTWATIPTDNLAYWSYSAWDPVLASRLAEEFWPRINADPALRAAYDREMAVAAVLYRSERRGIRVDPRYTSELQAKWTDRITVLRAELDDMGLKNPGSGPQIAKALKDISHWDPTEFTETGLPKTGEEVLKYIDSPIAERVIEYKRLKKWTSTYLNVFLRDRDENDMVHPSINTLQAKTGRMSITGPPMQTLPSGDPTIRDCIIAPEGTRLYMADYDNMEMYAFAHYSQDPGLMQAARDGLDMHKYGASIANGIPMEEVTKAQRKIAKLSVSFGKLYGAGRESVASAAGVSLEAIDIFLERYDREFPGVASFMETIISTGRRRWREESNPYITTWGGRKAISDSDKLYALVNYLIQGSCADLLKHKIVELDKAGFGDNIVLPVHDELLFAFPEGDTRGPAEAAYIMEERQMFTVPFTVETSGPYCSWGAKYREEAA